MSALEIRLVLSCPHGAVDCLTRIREVLDTVVTARTSGVWPSLGEWEKLLPSWFVLACASPMSTEEADASMKRWRAMPDAEQARFSEQEQWSLPNWLYWMEPRHAVWKWVRAMQCGPTQLEVTLAVDGLPVALGAFKWLARTAGADRITDSP